MSPLPPLTIGAWLRHGAVERALREARPASVLEIGPGLGAMAARLAGRYRYTAVETDDVSYCAAVDAVASSPDATVLPEWDALPPTDRFDLVCAFEVLEHIEDDVGALRTWRERLGRAGYVLLSTPSGPDRFGPWDEKVGHLRRYSRSQLDSVLGDAGFRLVMAESVGAGLGHVLEAARDLLARRQVAAGTGAQRTASSARQLQTRRRLHGWANAGIAAPFRAFQRPFAATEVGTGLVALGRATT